MKAKGPAPALPFANTVGDSFELMKKMWGMAGLPGMPNAGNLASMAVRLPQQLPSMVAPTFDINELDKRIADLRAVEQWLELNTSMLRTTIQTLEVQRATIATLKGISGAMLAPLNKPSPRVEMPPVPAVFAPQAAPAEKPPPVAHKSGGRKRTRAKPAHAPTVADAPLNPAAWWNTLQDQFGRIAATATTSAAAAPSQPARKASRPRRKSGKKP